MPEVMFMFANIPANWKQREYAKSGRNIFKRYWLRLYFAYRDWRQLDHVFPSANQ